MEDTPLNKIKWFKCPHCLEEYDSDFITNYFCPICGLEASKDNTIQE